MSTSISHQKVFDPTEQSRMDQSLRDVRADPKVGHIGNKVSVQRVKSVLCSLLKASIP